MGLQAWRGRHILGPPPARWRGLVCQMALGALFVVTDASNGKPVQAAGC